jgi:hypothetical protein
MYEPVDLHNLVSGTCTLLIKVAKTLYFIQSNGRLLLWNGIWNQGSFISVNHKG